MAEIIGVRFKNVGKIYYFDPAGHTAAKGEQVIVETARGTECGEVVMSNREIDDKKVTQPLKRVLRIATEKDLEKIRKNREREGFAYKVCAEKIRAHKLDMKLIDVEYTFDNNKILFYFTADGRVDFRELVKDLASVLKTRIELRQIGVRDEAKMLGGLGICGRPFCCSTFLGEFQPVSIKMAKEQGLSLNPAKISGTCGRLMCCLKYEQAAYEDLLKNTPKVGAYVQTPEGRGTVTEVSLMTGNLKVALDKFSGSNSNDSISVFHRDQLSPCTDERGDGAEPPTRQQQQQGGGQRAQGQRPPRRRSGRRGGQNRGGQASGGQNRGGQARGAQPKGGGDQAKQSGGQPRGENRGEPNKA